MMIKYIFLNIANIYHFKWKPAYINFYFTNFHFAKTLASKFIFFGFLARFLIFPHNFILIMTIKLFWRTNRQSIKGFTVKHPYCLSGDLSCCMFWSINFLQIITHLSVSEILERNQNISILCLIGLSINSDALQF